MSTITAPLPDLQVEFYKRLLQLRDVLLLDALLKTAGNLDVTQVDAELASIASKQSLSKLASWGLRGELLFAVPLVLTANPHLLGYYRLLLGFSQKEFYTSAYGLSGFKAMEERGTLRPSQSALLPDLCRALAGSSHHLVRAVGTLSSMAIHDLTLLTLGPQLRGGKLNFIGAQATQRVFDLIKTTTAHSAVAATPQKIELLNPAGRTVIVEFASDPDITIRELLPSGDMRNLVAIEIKGGKDVSNVHNRIGEAEKSHLKARKEGFTECWTIVGVAKLDMALARKESPSTDRFFNIDAVALQDSPEASSFRERLLALTGLSS